MEFFNKKEEVIDIQLTPYGRYLYSLGRFKPVYYSFHDADILYDGRHARLKEGHNRAGERVKEAPRLHTQAVFGGVESRRKENTAAPIEGGVEALFGANRPTLNGSEILAGLAGGRRPLTAADIGSITAAVRVDPNAEEEPQALVPPIVNFEAQRDFAGEMMAPLTDMLIERETQRLQRQAGKEGYEVDQEVPVGRLLEKVQPTRDFHAITDPLGTSILSGSYYPAWDIRYLKGRINKSEAVHTGSVDNSAPVSRIPQLHSEMTYKTRVETISDPSALNPESPIAESAISFVAEDGSMLTMKEDFFLLMVEEEHAPFGHENFDIEVYRVIEREEPNAVGTTKTEQLIPLQFLKNQELEPDTRNVEYYLSIQVDEEIDNDVLYDIRNIEDFGAIDDSVRLTDIYEEPREPDEVCD